LLLLIAKIDVTIIALLTFIKTVKNIVTYIKILVLVVLTGISLTSCKKNGDIIVPQALTELNTINANSYAINVYQNGTRLNNLGSIGAGGQSTYFAVAAGTQQYQLKRASPDSPDYLMDFPLSLDPNKKYSLFVAGETADRKVVIEDKRLNSSGTQAMIRFVNTLPGTDNLDVTIGSTSYTNTVFKSDSPYSYINPGDHNLKIYRTGSTTPVIDQNINLSAGTIYTIFTVGTLTGTGANKLTAKMILN
jgi:hypothetical protein